MSTHGLAARPAKVRFQQSHCPANSTWSRRHSRGDKRDLTDDYYPAFIWFPSGQPYERAQQLCPEEFSRVIGANIELRSVTIEATPDAPLLTRLEIKAPWLDEIRINQKKRFGDFLDRNFQAAPQEPD